MYDDYYGGTTLAHHGIKGMKWGVRRYQNEDGSLTPAGIKRYSRSVDKAIDKADRTGRTKNRAAVTEQLMREWYDSESSNRIKEFDKKHNINLDSTKGPVRFPVNERGEIDRDVYTKRQDLYKVYQDEGVRIVKKYEKELAGAVLRDIGEPDTRRGREFLLKYYKKIV